MIKEIDKRIPHYDNNGAYAWDGLIVDTINELVQAVNALEEKMQSNPPCMGVDIRERLAALCHDQWSGWMRYLFGKCGVNPDGSSTIPPEYVARWSRQMTTVYAELSGDEQESDRKEADKFLSILGKNRKNERDENNCHLHKIDAKCAWNPTVSCSFIPCRSER
jgi:hypothetical protein